MLKMVAGIQYLNGDWESNTTALPMCGQTEKTTFSCKDDYYIDKAHVAGHIPLCSILFSITVLTKIAKAIFQFYWNPIFSNKFLFR